ncbi:MAG TPA: methyl-accepting chemotaxis protein [Spirochaetota bacterium]|nr:methyl-accepting chemotaxis protein [Spirochaetota bacterium]HPJ37838.1 methyl-accepting chemotaxis protein [Spirochaetota bacterium]HPQ53545.1 methyl-accepting chemotaxis protein [Spirochaetota bacterium]
MQEHYTVKEQLEIRGIKKSLILTTAMTCVAAFFQKLALVPIKTIITTSLPFLIIIGIIYLILQRKKARKKTTVLKWVSAFMLASFPILAKYNYAISIDWLYAAQGIHIAGLSMLSLIILQFYYDKKLYLFFIVYVFLHWSGFLYAAHLHGVEMPLHAIVNGQPHIGIILLRQIYFILMMICIAYASYTNIPEMERFDEQTSRQRKIIEEQSRHQHELASEIKENISELFSELDDQHAVIDDFNDQMQGQASTFEEISATIEELQSSSESISNSAEKQSSDSSRMDETLNNFRELKKEIQEKFDETIRAIEAVVNQTTAGKEKVENVVATINEIKEQSNRIGQTITIIIDIADKINLLSLNASIEAARAGEHGRGFAVVADEIGKLAVQTSDSTKEIESLLKQNSVTTSGGVDVINEASVLIRGMIEQIAQNSDRIKSLQSYNNREVAFLDEIQEQMKLNLALSKDIGLATAEQKHATESTSKSVEHVNEMIMQMADGVSNLAASFKKIADNAGKLSQKSSEVDIADEA